MSPDTIIEIAKLTVPALGAVAGAYAAVSRKLVQFEERRVMDRRDVDQLQVTVYGNGRPGLTERTRDLEGEVKHLREAVRPSPNPG